MAATLENESSTDPTAGDDNSGSLGGGDDDGIRWRTVGLIAGALVAMAAIIGLGIALWPSSGSDQDEAEGPEVTASESESEPDEAEDLVAEWADATTSRNGNKWQRSTRRAHPRISRRCTAVPMIRFA